MDDRPGTLARVAVRLADLECNVLGLTVLPFPGGVLDEIVVRPAVGLTREQLVRAMRDEDCECLGITGADVRELVDPATAALAAVGRAVTEPDRIAEAVGDVLAADVVTVVPAAEANPARTEAGHRAVLGTGTGRAIVARRRWAPFAPQELARAEALLTLLGTIDVNLSGPAVVTCADGATLVLRSARPGDADAVLAMHRRCSPRSLLRRCPTGFGAVTRRGLQALLAPPNGTVVLAVCGREVVAIGALLPQTGAEIAGVEVSVLVEDGWQRGGVGTVLLRRLALLASAHGHRAFTARCPYGDDAFRRTAVRAGLAPVVVPGDVEDEATVLHITLGDRRSDGFRQQVTDVSAPAANDTWTWS